MKLRSSSSVVAFLAFASLRAAELEEVSPDRLWYRAPGSSAEYALDKNRFSNILATAPMELVSSPSPDPVIVTFPMPDGTFSRFRVERSPILETAVEEQLPDLATFSLQGIDEPRWVGRMTWSPRHTRAFVLTGARAAVIEPGDSADGRAYRSRWDTELIGPGYQCLNEDSDDRANRDVVEARTRPSIGAARGKLDPRTQAVTTLSLRTYKLAVFATGEYTQYHGGTSAATSAITQVVNDVNALFRRDVGIRLSVVNTTVYPDPNTDPLDPTNLTTLNSAVQVVIDQAVGSSNYDIGILFHAGGGAIGKGKSSTFSLVGTACMPSVKGSAYAMADAPTGPLFSYLVAHELGHVLGAHHTWNGIGCGLEVSPVRFEPGSGTTLLSASGRCLLDNVRTEPYGDLVLHAGSRGEIDAFVAQNLGCGTSANTTNNFPTVNAGPDHTIPRETPFTLTATGSDPDTDSLTYSWEEYDIGPKAAVFALDDGAIPLFRSYPPVPEATRTFPRLADLRAGGFSLFPTKRGEQLPSVDATRTFRVTARDNNAAGGAAAYDDVLITIAGAPFRVTSPVAGDKLECASPETLTWSVGGGSVAANVDLLLSTDDGATFQSLLAGTGNDGTESVTVPTTLSNGARLKIDAVGNVFFALSEPFSIVDTTPPTITCPGNISVECTQPNGIPASDPQVSAFLSGATPADLCDTSPTVKTNAPALFKTGTTTTVTFTARDDGGNLVTCTADVTVTGSDCPEGSCKPGSGISLNAARQTVFGEAPGILSAVRERARAKRPAGRASKSVTTIVSASIDGNQILNVVGSATNDEIVFRLKSGDPSKLEVLDAITNPQNVYEFDVVDFVGVTVRGDDGDDTLVLDDSNGAIATLAPFDIREIELSLGATGTLSIQNVLTLVQNLQGAQSLLTAADAVIEAAGAIDPLGASGSDLITRQYQAIDEAQANLVVPGANIVGGIPTALIDPAAAAIEGAVDPQNGFLGAGFAFFTYAYNGLVLDTLCTLASVCGPATPDQFAQQAMFPIRDLAEGFAAEADTLQQTAQQGADPCIDRLSGSGKDGFVSRLQLLKSQLENLATQCSEADDLLPGQENPVIAYILPDFCRGAAPVGGGSVHPPREFFNPANLSQNESSGETAVVALSPQIYGCLDGIEAIVDCMEQEIVTFEVAGDACEAQFDAFATGAAEDPGSLGERADTQLTAAADALESAVEDANGLEDQADALALQADAFEAAGAAFESATEAPLEATGGVFESQSDALAAAGDSYAVQTESDLDGLTAALLQLADSLTAQAESLISSTLAQLDPQGLRPARLITACSEIAPTHTVTGSAAPEILLGTFGDDTIDGGGGPDLIIGLAGNDRLSGGDGLDLIFGGAGVNEIHGGDGIDLLVGGKEKDCIFGDDAIDVILGRDGDDELNGGKDTDLIIGGAGADVEHGDDGIDVLLGGPGANQMHGDNCVDVLIGGLDNDQMTGGPGQVVSIGNVAVDFGDLLIGRDGDDVMHGDEGNDSGTGIDVVIGGPGADDLFGANGGEFTVGTSFKINLGGVILGGTGNDDIVAATGIDVLLGGPDDDTISAGDGFELDFGNGNFTLNMGDLLFGQGGNDTLRGDDVGGAGIDLLFGGPGNDIIHGEDGGKLHVNSFDVTIGNLSIGGTGNDQITCKAGIDLMFGGPDDDTMSAGNGYELNLSNGNFILNFGDFMFGGPGVDRMHGDAPSDSGAEEDGIDWMFGGGDGDFLYGGDGGRLLLGGVHLDLGNFFFGSQGDDTLVADFEQNGGNEPGIDFMFGGAGADTMHGRDGGLFSIGEPPTAGAIFGNLMFGSAGNDTMTSGNGLDVMFGNPGNDTMDSGEGVDLVFGGANDDDMNGGDGGVIVIPVGGVPAPIPFGNLMFGSDGADVVDSGGRTPLLEIDLLFGNDCDDVMHGGDGLLDIMFGNKGNDTVDGQASLDFLFGNRGNDIVLGGPGLIDLLFGNRGDDQLDGGDGVDLVFGNRDDDQVATGDGLLNVAFGNRGRDVVQGGLGIDLVFGNRDEDEVYGKGGLDLAFGNDDNDVVYGGSGIDLVFGNRGDDIVGGDCEPGSQSCADGVDLVFGNRGNDVVYGGGSLDLLFGNGDDDVLFGEGGLNLVFGNSGSDVLLGGSSTNLLFGNADDDQLYGGGALDLVFGNAGNDCIHSGGSTDLVFGNRDNDRISGEGGDDLLFGNRGDDMVQGNDGDDLVFGNRDSDDVMGGPGGKDFVFGNSGNDDAEAAADTQDFVFGNRDDDGLWGCNEDKLFGGPGNDNKDKPNCSSLSIGGCGFAQGTKWVDRNGSGVIDAGDTRLGGVTITMGSSARVTASHGDFQFRSVGAGPYTVSEAVPLGYTKLVPGGSYGVSIGVGSPAFTGLDFLNRDDCGPGPNGVGCAPCPCAGTLVPISEDRCTTDGSRCSSDSDCSCGGVCATTVIDCRCVSSTGVIPDLTFAQPCFECGDDLVILLGEPTGFLELLLVQALGPLGIEDQEMTFAYVLNSAGQWVATIPTSCASPPTAGNGILETQPGQTVYVSYSQPFSPPVSASIAVSDACPGFEVEVNNVCTQGQTWTLGSTLFAALDPTGDSDCYKLVVPSALPADPLAPVDVEVSTSGFRPIDNTVVRVFSGATQIGCDDESGPDLFSSWRCCLTPGTYCVQAKAFEVGEIPLYRIHSKNFGGCMPTPSCPFTGPACTLRPGAPPPP